MLMTVPYPQPMCSTTERKWSLFFQTLLVFTNSPDGRVGCKYSCKESCVGSSPNVGMSFLNCILFIFCACCAHMNNKYLLKLCLYIIKIYVSNFCVELIPTATGNGYPKCNYSVMNMRSSNFHMYIYLNNIHMHNFNEYLCKHNVRKKINLGFHFLPTTECQ
jgi:hypothetical protein